MARTPSVDSTDTVKMIATDAVHRQWALIDVIPKIWCN